MTFETARAPTTERLRELLEERDEEVRQLKAELAPPDFVFPIEWKLTGMEEKLFRHLLAREIVTREGAAIALGLDEEKDRKAVDVYLTRIRQKTNAVGVEIVSHFGRGWQLVDRARWRENLRGGGMMSKAASLDLPADLREELERRAAADGGSVHELALDLLLAAWTARKQLDRGELNAASELDRLVRVVLLLGDCEPSFVASATGAPVSVVERVLEGWRRTVASGPAEIATDPAVETPARRGKRQSWNEADRVLLKELWGEGLAIAAIGERLGRPATAVQQYAVAHRDLCPKRR